MDPRDRTREKVPKETLTEHHWVLVAVPYELLPIKLGESVPKNFHLVPSA